MNRSKAPSLVLMIVLMSMVILPSVLNKVSASKTEADVTGDPPTINATPVSRTAGSPSANSQIAMVSDAEDAENTLAVTVNGGSTATVGGVTVSGIGVSAAGAVTANVVAACGATTASFTLRVTDSEGLFAEAMLTVTVTPNPAPTLGNYPPASVAVGSATTVTPDAGPSDNGTIISLTASAPGFTGALFVSLTTGVVTIINFSPVGSYTVTVTARDNCNAVTTATFTLIVSNVELGNYPDATVSAGANTTVTPDAVPTNTARINVSTSTSFQGTLTANPATGVVRVTDANPAGTYVVTVTAFNDTGEATTRTFNLMVETPSPACATPSFISAASVNAGEGAASVAVGDFNNDGKQDLAIANNEADTVSIRLGTGTSSFTGFTNVPVGVPPPGIAVQPIQVVVGDFNGDGNQDFATANLRLCTVSIRLGNGAGSFTGATPTSEITLGDNQETSGLAVGDFNGDGKLDLAVATRLANKVSILIGDGLGAFNVSSDLTLADPQSVTVGDFNNDGNHDLAIALTGSVAIRLGDGMGGFSGSTIIDTGANSRPRSLAIGDFNGDGQQDLATANAGTNSTNNTVSIALGNGTGGFSSPSTVTVETGPFSLAIGDFDKDGKQDFAVANINSTTVSIRLGDGMGGFSGSMSVPTGSRPISVAIGDFNGEGTLDFVVVSNSNGSASVRLGVCTPNIAPTISAQSGLTRQQGSIASNSPIATVSDVENGAGGVIVSVTSANPSNGVRLLNIVNNNGTITANISTTCTATNATFTLQASDGGLATAATLSIDVTPNSAPVLTYSSPLTILAGASTMVNPATGPSDNGTFSVAFLNVSPNTFTGTISANTSTGVVTITNAAPEGAYTINLRMTDNCDAVTDASFTLNVTNAATWNGSTSSNWNAAANWTPGFVPSSPNDVIIPESGVANEAVLSAATATVRNLTVAAGRTLALSGRDMTVNGVLTLSGGLIDAGANTLTLGAAATISRTSGKILGNLKKQFSGAGSFTYTVGTANGYSPVDVTVTAGTGDLTVKAVQGNQPLLDSARSLKRYWTMNGAGVTINMVLHYLDPEDIAGNEATYRLIRVTGSESAVFPDGCDTGSPCVDPNANTATINGVSSFSDWTIGEPTSPTAVDLVSFTATGYDGGVFVEWKTGNEVRNLGFNIYREQGGQRSRINTDIIAGSALKVGLSVSMRAGYSYGWWDRLSLSSRDVSYYLEDIDIDGHGMLHGPFTVNTVGGKPPAASQAETLSNLRGGHVFTGPAVSATQSSRSAGAVSPAQFDLAGKLAVKMTIKEEGWYRVTQTELASAGFDTRSNPRNLQLFVDGVEQPMLVVGESDNSFDASDAVEFYATGKNSLSSDARIYWLAAGAQAGKRINVIKTSGQPGGGHSFLQAVERRERLIYFSSLLNGDAENFFGSVIASQPVEQPLTLQHVDTNSRNGAEIEIALQGVNDLPASGDHKVSVALNGVIIGRVIFDGREHRVERFSIHQYYLREGDNQIILMSEGGAGDISLVDYVRVSYWRRYVADEDVLRLSASFGNGMTQTIEGFSAPSIRVFDITDLNAVTEIAGLIESKDQSYSVTVSVNGPNRTLLAVSDAKIKRPAAIALNEISSLRNPSQGADLLIITARKFFASLAPLVALRQSQGMSVSLVDVENVYDEFNYGEKAVNPIKEFLAYTQSSWKKKPRFVLLGGDASFDAKNYLGFGDFDLLPTRLIDTTLMETASDDWLVDFNDDGVAGVAIGRLPFRTTGEAVAMVAKITIYERSAPSDEVVLSADADDGYGFEADSDQLRRWLPGSLRVNAVYRGRMDAEKAKAALMDAINRGQKLVNYVGHGSVEQWRGNLLAGADGLAMTNREGLSVFVLMTCLNGYYDDPALESLAESLLKAEGGAVAVWSSSGMCLPNEQAPMNQEFYRLLFSGSAITIGEAARSAKQAASSSDVRRSWILLGDPSMRLK